MLTANSRNLFAFAFFSACVFLIAITPSDSADCSLNWSSNLPSYFPLIWQDKSIVYPEIIDKNNWSIKFTSKTPLEVGCSNIKNNLRNFNQPVASLKCTSKGIQLGKATVTFEDLGCTDSLTEQVVKVGQCDKDFDNVTIQFESPNAGFPLIDVCHNPKRDETVLTHHIIHGGGLNKYEVSNKRPGFKEAQYYKEINANEAYSQKSQLNFVADLVKSKKLAEKYIDKSKSFYFARGHLAPDGDFVHVYEQNGTYFFINVVPQWQSINNGNWKALEFALRRYAMVKNVNLEIWTGTKDVLRLDDNKGNPVEIYLAKDKSGNLILPAPEITWKVIYEPTSNSAVVVIIINNPHLKTVPKELILCPDICSKISWVNWKVNNIPKGFTYCCTWESAKKFLKFVPNFSGSKLKLLT